MSAGFMGRVLFIDLTSKEYEIKDLDMDIARNYLGGLGINSSLMDKNYISQTNTLSPDIPVILGAGPLIGTGVPGASKIVATTRFPLNRTISESVGSMRFARNMKAAGFDHIVIKGRAKSPIVLIIDDKGISFKSAGKLWGLDIFDTTDVIKDEYGREKSSVIAIGPAGENECLFSLALVDKASTLGRGGIGALMGSKNLKAIVSAGSLKPKVHNQKLLKSLLSGIRERLKRFKNHQRVLELGIMENWDNYLKQFCAYKNLSQVFPKQKAHELYGTDVYRAFKIRGFGCPSCFTPDKDYLEVKDGPFKGFKTTSTSYFNTYLMGYPFNLNSSQDKTAGLRMMDILDRLGIDMFTFRSIMDFLTAESENGNLDPQYFDIPLKRDFNVLNEWAHSISHRKGKADIVAQGWGALLNHIGEQYRVRAPIVKTCDLIWEPRLVGLGTMEFEQLVSLKGPRSASGGSPTYIPELGEDNLSLFERHLVRMGAGKDAINRVMDSPYGFNVGRMTRYSEDWYIILSSLGICNRHFINRFYSAQLCRELFIAVTGFEIEDEHLQTSAQNIWHLLKRLNHREGFTIKDDYPPEIWFTPIKGENGEPLILRDYFGKSNLGPKDIEQLIYDYYNERQWEEE